MISDREIWQCALLMVKRYGDDAMLEAAGRADQVLGDEHRPALAAATPSINAPSWHTLVLMTGGVARRLFARLHRWLRDRLIEARHPVANRLQATAPFGGIMQSPKCGSDGSVHCFVVHAPNVGAGLYDSILFCHFSFVEKLRVKAEPKHAPR